MDRSSKISPAEWEVMEIIWKQAPITSQEIIQKLSGQKKWQEKTIRTMLNRLVKKKVLSFSKQGRSYSYTPLMSYEQCALEASQHFINRVFGGSFTPMLAYFVDKAKLSDREIQELRQILDDSSK